MVTIMKKLFGLCSWCLVFILNAVAITPISAAQYTLSWNPVNDQSVSGYIIYYGVGHLNYAYSLDVGNVTTYTISNLDPNTVYYFAVKAKTSSGQESNFSNEVTSGYFRYTFGMGSYPNNSGQLQVININQAFEQSAPVGWSEYNALSGESRIAAGDIDGDSKDEVIVGFAPVKDIPGGKFQLLDDDFSHLLWGQVDWADYNYSGGETRPAVGDVDGDGKDEIIIGLGKGGEGILAIYRFANGILTLIGWANINWPEYSQANGETWPATGDVDGDGKDEIVIGLGSGGGGKFFLKKGFDAARLASGVDPWLNQIQGKLSWADYATQIGETRPSIGDLDGDNKGEIAMGLGQSGGGNVEIFTVSSPSILPLKSVEVGWSGYNSTNGETRPVIGDIDGDQLGEIIIGLGPGGGGYIDQLDDASTQFSKINSLQVGTPAYQTANGSFWPAFKQERVFTPEASSNYSLTVTSGSGGMVTSIPAGINCGTDCSETYASGTSVTLTATPATGHVFSGWSGTCTDTGGTCNLSMNAAKSVTAAFNAIPNYNLMVTSGSGGTVTSIPAGINCGTDCSETYASGTSVTLTATPATGYTFSSWSGACTSTGSCNVTMDATKSVTATYKASKNYTLTVKRNGTGTVTSTPAGITCGSDCTEPYASGTTVTLKATPETGYRFTGWSGACTGTSSCNVTMSVAKSVTATFKK